MSVADVVAANRGIVIKTSRACEQEKVYIFDWILREVLGIDYEIFWNSESSTIEITHSERDGAIVFIDDFFSGAEMAWLSPQGLPLFTTEVTYNDESIEKSVSVFHFESNQPQLPAVDNATTRTFEFDLFGSLFFLISRYEEKVVEERDEHDRFPGRASVLSKFEMLDRPIGNEYIELLWSCLSRLWPTLKRKQRRFRVLPSHDMDVPSKYWKPFVGTVRASLGSIGRGRLGQEISAWKSRSKYATMIREKNWQDDPYDTINWIMDQSETNGLTSAFYYIPEKTHRHDPGMPIDHPHVVDQWERISSRGHEIGLHPGYDTYLWPDRIKSGAQKIRRQLERLKIDQPLLGGRQHYLRWKSPETAIAWNNAGMDYDSTLAFADRPGFRCGVCYEFPMYDLTRRRPLTIRQRPLVAMEKTLIEEKYMGLGLTPAMLDKLKELKDQCRKYNGDFTLLWHNQMLIHQQQRELYQEILAA